MFVDTHTHIYLEQFDNDRDDVVHNAIQTGVTRMLLPNINSETVLPMMSLCKQYPKHIFPMIGLHPTSVTPDYHKELINVEKELNQHKYIAIGEVGIDLYWDDTYIQEQKQVFDYQIGIALQYHLPVVVHMRNSFNEIWDVLQPYKNKNLKLVMHCFSGDRVQAEKIVDFGYYIGIGGVLTYKNSLISEIANYIPLENIVLETDAPYLAPVPYRGKRNEPKYIQIINNRLAEIRKADVHAVKLQTTQNAIDLFNL